MCFVSSSIITRIGFVNFVAAEGLIGAVLNFLLILKYNGAHLLGKKTEVVVLDSDRFRCGKMRKIVKEYFPPPVLCRAFLFLFSSKFRCRIVIIILKFPFNYLDISCLIFSAINLHLSTDFRTFRFV